MASADAPRPAPTRRNWLLIVLPVAIVLVCLCPIGICGGIFFSVITGVKRSEPYQTAVRRVQESPEVRDRLGQPIEVTSYTPTGSVETNGWGGQASLDFKVSGPNGGASVHTQAKRSGEIWTTTVLRVTFADGETIDLSALPGEATPSQE